MHTLARSLAARNASKQASHSKGMTLARTMAHREWIRLRAYANDDNNTRTREILFTAEYIVV